MFVAYILDKTGHWKSKIIIKSKRQGGVFQDGSFEYNIRRDRRFFKRFFIKWFFCSFYIEGYPEPLDFKDGSVLYGGSEVPINDIAILLRKFNKLIIEIIIIVIQVFTILFLIGVFIRLNDVMSLLKQVALGGI